MGERIVLYPAPFVGHIMSMIELGKLLLRHSPSGTSISILVPSCPISTIDSCSTYLSSVSPSFPSITFLFLPPVPLLLGSLSDYTDFEHIAFETLRSNNPNLLQSLHSLSLPSSPISAFILDFFCYSALSVSQSLNIPSYFFIPSGASFLAFLLNFPVYDTLYPDSLKNVQVSLHIPGFFSVPTDHMIGCMLHRGVSYYEFVKMAQSLTKSNGIITNTFDSLEERAVTGMKRGTCLPGTPIPPPIYCVGPLIANRGSSSSDGERHECLRWLDSQPSKSVVFLCFGSEGAFSKEQTMEIALGLETSGVRFLWVVRAPPPPPNKNNNSDVLFHSLLHPDLDLLLPKGFLDRTKGRGHVVKLWAPQIQVLAHQSIGAFVTHCGWNSTLEAICAGVPMVAWPLYAEQKFNKILLVEEIGIALPMDASQDGFVSSDEVEKRVEQIMSSEEANQVRKRVLDLKDKARVALGEGGSSTTALSMLIQSWNR